MTGWNQPCMRLFFNSLKNNDADISMTASIMEYPDGRQICPYQPNVHLVMTTSESFKYVNLPGYSTISAWSKLIKRSVLGDIRFPEGCINGEDSRFTYEVLAASKRTTFDSVPLYHYRATEGSLSRTYTNYSWAGYEATKQMVELVRRRFPEQLPFALYGLMRSMISLYDQALVTRSSKEQQWRRFAKDTQAFVRRNIGLVAESVDLPRGRSMQLKLMAVSPVLYSVSFLIYKRIHPERSK